MANQAMTLSIVEHARRVFFDEGMDPGTAIAPHVYRSWRRCSAQPPALEIGEPIARGLLSDRREAAAWLRQCAQPELDGLAEHALGQGCVVILSDASGVILDEIGSPEFLPKAHRVALAPGVDWSEARRGTNAIGTALTEREALLVLGGEHFLAQNGALGCAAAPIFNARGELAGVLDISGESMHVDIHALGLVRLAAAQVEHRMMSSRSEGQLVRFHRRPGLLGTPREGLLSVQDGIVVGTNRTALGLLGLSFGQVLGAPADLIFGAKWERLRRAPGLVASEDGQHWAVMVEQSPEKHPPRGKAPTTHALTQTPASQCSHLQDPEDALEPLLEKAARVAAEGLPLLVLGETGSGKEVFVRRLHQRSRRAQGPLVAVNCAALPEALIEAELFGYEEGAFTGARKRGSPGRLREAQGGILFLDEIGDMPLLLQARLLRVLEERTVRPLGGARDLPVDFDLVCATHRDLRQLVHEGTFRDDLRYRLQGYCVSIPALRDRSDKRSLISRLFREAGGDAKKLVLTNAALDALDGQAWPGNVRQLLSVLRTQIALADEGASVEAHDFDLEQGMPVGTPRGPAPAVASWTSQPDSLAALTEEAIQRALHASDNNITQAASLLGVHRSTLYRLLARVRRTG